MAASVSAPHYLGATEEKKVYLTVKHGCLTHAADKSFINLCHNKILLWSLGQCHQEVQRQVVISIKGKDFLASFAPTHTGSFVHWQRHYWHPQRWGKHLLNNMKPENLICAQRSSFVFQQLKKKKKNWVSPVKCCRAHWKHDMFSVAKYLVSNLVLSNFQLETGKEQKNKQSTTQTS